MQIKNVLVGLILIFSFKIQSQDVCKGWFVFQDQTNKVLYVTDNAVYTLTTFTSVMSLNNLRLLIS